MSPLGVTWMRAWAGGRQRTSICLQRLNGQGLWADFRCPANARKTFPPPGRARDGPPEAGTKIVDISAHPRVRKYPPSLPRIGGRGALPARTPGVKGGRGERRAGESHQSGDCCLTRGAPRLETLPVGCRRRRGGDCEASSSNSSPPGQALRSNPIRRRHQMPSVPDSGRSPRPVRDDQPVLPCPSRRSLLRAGVLGGGAAAAQTHNQVIYDVFAAGNGPSALLSRTPPGAAARIRCPGTDHSGNPWKRTRNLIRGERLAN